MTGRPATLEDEKVLGAPSKNQQVAKYFQNNADKRRWKNK
jgi:hypothetical protein